MNTTPPDDPQLRGLLREWKPDTALPPRFRESVWRRIEQAEVVATAPASTWWECLTQSLLQPKWATAGLLALVLLGGLSGFQAGADEAQRAAQNRYVAAVDPYQKGH